MPFKDLPGVTTCRFRKGERLIKMGEPIESVYYLIKGTVYRETVADKGYETILGRKNNTSVVSALVGGLAVYMYEEKGVSKSDYIARTDCLCYKIPRRTCMEYMRQHPELLEELLRLSLMEYENVLNLFWERKEGSSTVRLCEVLLKNARETENGLLVPRKITNVEISKMLGVHKVSVSRMLRSLREEGAVERTEEGLLLLRPERIQQYAEGDSVLKYE